MNQDDTAKLPKKFLRELRDKIHKTYPKSKGYWHYGSLIVKPFRTSQAEFLIAFRDGIYIIRESSGFDHDAKGSNTSVVHSLEDFKIPKCMVETTNGVVSFLKTCVEIYVESEKEFYDEGLELQKDWCASEEEAERLAGIIYTHGFLKELGIKE